MISLPAPLDMVPNTYQRCTSVSRPKSKRQRLLSEAPRIASRAVEYATKAPTKSFNLIGQQNPVHVSADELNSLYENILLNGSQNDTYLRIRAGARFGKCPLCAQRDVKTLDHYLPKGHYPEYSVLLPNLIPCCEPCNNTKGEYIPNHYREQLFHPYYDNWAQFPLLQAKVMTVAPIEISFYIQRPANFSAPNFRRAQKHFEFLELNQLYTLEAAVELVQKKQDFKDTFGSSGQIGLRDDLAHEARSRSTPFLNAWQPALYRALSASRAFYSGGFNNIEER